MNQQQEDPLMVGILVIISFAAATLRVLGVL